MDHDNKTSADENTDPRGGQSLNSEQAATSKTKPSDKSKAAAIELIRKKVEAAYGHEPLLEAEAKLRKTKPVSLSKHQRYAQSLVQSDMTALERHSAWHKYYSELSEAEKHEVWQEFYRSHGKATDYRAYIEARSKGHNPRVRPHRSFLNKKTSHPTSKPKRASGLHSLMVGLGAGTISVIIVLFGFFNERFIAPFIQPSRTLTNTQLISDANVAGGSPEIIIPKINVQIPVVYGVATIDEKSVDTALESGVVHYADTALPGQNGNVVIVGHSSNNIFNKGRYKFAFVLLNRLENGDTFYLQKDGKRYTYQIYEKKIVKPEDVSVLGPAAKPASATLITCDPPGTSANRLVVVGEQISPDPAANSAAANTTNQLATQSQSIPGDAPSLWSRLWGWLSD